MKRIEFIKIYVSLDRVKIEVTLKDFTMFMAAKINIVVFWQAGAEVSEEYTPSIFRIKLS
jgi:hypothetical protein